ncbi:SDR family oxidoreductase [Dactylosporangium sp. CA-139066]|uniref:SDR family oxidoreductase n=1 Tax=Dactylosporangium sp. CA-139066 TaxID=3239930 RepID=UPI003D8B23E3
MAVLVTGATGSIGKEVVAGLLARGADVRALVRSAERAARLPEGVEAAIGDLRDPASVAAALDGVTAALYVSPHDAAEEAMAAGFIAACERAGTRIVFAGVYANASNAATRFLLRSAFSLMLPKYRGKLRLSRAIERSRTRPVLFQVSNYYQNDEVVREDILGGDYPLPTHPRGINRVDLRDVGEVAARALVDPAFPAGGHSLVGPASVAGARAAQVWADTLGRPVRYHGPESDWRERLGRRLEGQKRTDFIGSFSTLSRFSMPTSPAQVEAMTRLLGRPPRSYETYVADTAARWAEPASDPA